MGDEEHRQAELHEGFRDDDARSFQVRVFGRLVPRSALLGGPGPLPLGIDAGIFVLVAVVVELTSSRIGTERVGHVEHGDGAA